MEIDKKSTKYFMEEMTQKEFEEIFKCKEVSSYYFNKIKKIELAKEILKIYKDDN